MRNNRRRPPGRPPKNDFEHRIVAFRKKWPKMPSIVLAEILGYDAGWIRETLWALGLDTNPLRRESSSKWRSVNGFTKEDTAKLNKEYFRG